jgi:hypothetical protein
MTTTYTLITLFVVTGHSYVEREGLSLQGCAGHAAMARQEMLDVQERLEGLVGEIRYLCLPEYSLARQSTDEHGIGEGWE